MNILLINGNITRCAKSGYGLTPAPAGLTSLAGVLRRRGHDVRIRQAFSHVLPQEEDLPLLRRELGELLGEFYPDVIGISCRNIWAARRPSNPLRLIEYYSAFYDARLVRMFRTLCSSPIVMGGTAFSIEPALYLKSAKPDFGIIGEAEESLPALVDALQAGKELPAIDGLITESAADAWHAIQPARVQDLAAVGVGACDLVNNFRDCYYEGGGFVPIQTKRGCPMDCIYCTAARLEGKCYRFRLINDVIAEMLAYRDTRGVRHFFFVDSTFNHPIDHALEVCDAILQARLQIEWIAEVTPVAISDALAAAMKRSGCIGLTLTPDSCSNRVLKSYGKNMDTKQVAEAIAVLRRHKIPFDTCLIVGGPGETRETLVESMDFCGKHLANDVVRFYDGMIVTSCSKSYDLARSEGVINATKPYADLVLDNDFRAVKSYDYFFPHLKQPRKQLMDWIGGVCTGPRWLLAGRDYVPDPQSGELTLRPEIQIAEGSRPWWKGLRRTNERRTIGV
ncbi:MAG: radical SAM protein [Planctomycetota bacterium]|nr:radical SAM protein [Planctomycetota bacterium]